METAKMAKCNKYKYSFCTHKHDAPECEDCILIKRHGKMYKYINGQRYKKCPQCNEYKPLSAFKTNSQGNRSWCYDCHKKYARERHYTNDKSFMVSHRIDMKKTHIKIDSVPKLIKYIRKCIDNDTRLIEIKQI